VLRVKGKGTKAPSLAAMKLGRDGSGKKKTGERGKEKRNKRGKKDMREVWKWLSPDFPTRGGGGEG